MPQHGESGWETRACSPNRKTFWVLATESMWLYGMLELERIRFSHNNFETVLHGSEEFDTACGKCRHDYNIEWHRGVARAQVAQPLPLDSKPSV